MVVGLGRRELASSLLAVASLPSPLTPTSPLTPAFGLLPPAVTFGVQIYDDDTAERLTLQAHEANVPCHARAVPYHARTMPCHAHVVHMPFARRARAMHTPCTRHAMCPHSSRACRPSPWASVPSSRAPRAATSSASPAPYATQASNHGRAGRVPARPCSATHAFELLTRASLASDRSPAAAYRGSSCTSQAPCSRTSRWASLTLTLTLTLTP